MPSSYTSIALAFFLLALLALTGAIIQTADGGKLTLTNEAILSAAPPVAIEPRVLAEDDDGGFIIAGGIPARQQAWAAKVDRTGRMVWQYTLGVDDKLPIGQGASFNGLVVMPNATTFLCGNMPRPPGTFIPSLVVMLDRYGHLIYKRFLSAQENTERGVVFSRNCIGVAGGVVVINSVMLVQPSTSMQSTPSAPHVETFYWLVMLDATGKEQWQVRVPTALGLLGDRGSVTLMKDSSIVFAAWRSNETELFRVTESGKVAVLSTLRGRYVLIPSTQPASRIRLFGYNIDGSSALVTLNENLEELSREVSSVTQRHFAATGGFGLPNALFLLYGSEIRDYGRRLASQVLLLDKQLRPSGELGFDNQSYDDIGSIAAVAPTRQPDEFVVARTLLRRAPRRGGVGAALDFIKVK